MIDLKFTTYLNTAQTENKTSKTVTVFCIDFNKKCNIQHPENKSKFDGK